MQTIGIRALLGTNVARSEPHASLRAIGATTTYHGTEHRYLQGYELRIVAVLKGAAAPDYDADTEGAYVTDEAGLQRAGGVTVADRVEVQPWIAQEGRFSFVSSDPRAIDLACFAHLAR